MMKRGNEQGPTSGEIMTTEEVAESLEELMERAAHVPNVVLADEVVQLQARLAERDVPEWARRLTGRDEDAA